MKNTILKTVGCAALAILMLAVFAQIPAFAQDAGTEEESNKQTEGTLLQTDRNTQGFVGTWDVQVTIRNCQTGAPIVTFASLTTFLPGGITLDSTSRIPQSLKTPGQGVWEHLTGRTYRFKFKSFSFDTSGNFTGWTIITHEALLNRSATAYTSAGISEVYNASGNLIATGCSTTTTIRFE